MQVKVFQAADMTSGLKMVKDELGPDALILSTKSVRSGKLGLLGKNTFEITAAIDSDWPDNKNTSSFTSGTYDRTLRVKNTFSPEDNTGTTSETKNTDQAKLQSEVDELKGMLKDLGQEVSRMSSRQNHQSISISPGEVPVDPLQQRILELGISRDTAKTITDYAKESLTFDDLSDPFVQRKYLADTIEELLHVSNDLFKNKREGTQHRLALIGPTGVGKTTSLAKIAANYLGKHSASIAFITIDTYRIAAVEQLKVYGDIMSLPVEVAITPEQFEQALFKFRDKDLILIDTAGRSPQDSFCIDELKSFLRADLAIEKHLVLSATTRESELYEAIDRFSVLGIDHAIMTKIDECKSLGILLDLQIRKQIPYSFVTNGQRVPEDIMEADQKSLTTFILSPGEGSSYE